MGLPRGHTGLLDNTTVRAPGHHPGLWITQGVGTSWWPSPGTLTWPRTTSRLRSPVSVLPRYSATFVSPERRKQPRSSRGWSDLHCPDMPTRGSKGGRSSVRAIRGTTGSRPDLLLRPHGEPCERGLHLGIRRGEPPRRDQERVPMPRSPPGGGVQAVKLGNRATFRSCARAPTTWATIHAGSKSNGCSSQRSTDDGANASASRIRSMATVTIP